MTAPQLAHFGQVIVCHGASGDLWIDADRIDLDRIGAKMRMRDCGLAIAAPWARDPAAGVAFRRVSLGEFDPVIFAAFDPLGPEGLSQPVFLDLFAALDLVEVGALSRAGEALPYRPPVRLSVGGVLCGQVIAEEIAMCLVTRSC
ncbi:hypothetical protein [Phaeobacter sp. C3_T13_0]|uniref:hypothetical protein n=1 Tax=Phaeobacter cretensis TaxID=3342641 RepID=UPI0039BCDC2C